ncbi:hypothetical protein [Arenibacterium halophilum]|uniref:hypothetical protein n=1 Tax=Arenibacterium halophilum TaxID=2583821 RepID=UPI001487500D|nr:hypothetical protein [Arenibacterium halophilum]
MAGHGPAPRDSKQAEKNPRLASAKRNLGTIPGYRETPKNFEPEAHFHAPFTHARPDEFTLTGQTSAHRTFSASQHMNQFISRPRSGKTSGASQPRKWRGLISRIFGLPRIDPIDEVFGLPPQLPTLHQNPNLW